MLFDSFCVWLRPWIPFFLFIFLLILDVLSPSSGLGWKRSLLFIIFVGDSCLLPSFLLVVRSEMLVSGVYFASSSITLLGVFGFLLESLFSVWQPGFYGTDFGHDMAVCGWDCCVLLFDIVYLIQERDSLAFFIPLSGVFQFSSTDNFVAIVRMRPLVTFC